MTKTYVFHSDPGHGWLAVPLADLSALGVAERISRCSYVRGGTAYLEEDCDLAVFAHYAKAAGWALVIVEAPGEAHFVRALPAYREAPGYDYRANMAAIYAPAEGTAQDD